MKRKGILLLSLDIAVLLGFFLLDNIAKYMIDFFPECFFYSNFGVQCTTCGATRCFYYFFSFDIKNAFFSNQYIFALIVYAIILFVMLNLSLFRLDFAKKASRAMTSPTAVISWAILFVLFTAYRIFT